MNAAEERLLDAALAQVFVGRRHAAAPAAGTAPWLAAALMLLGVLVTATTMWLARGDVRGAAQQPEPLPPPVSADGRTALEGLPADTQNLIALVLSPADAEVLARFRSLRKLVLMPANVRIGPVDTGKQLPAWATPPPDLLAPLAKLPALDSLQIASPIAAPPTVLAPLAGSTSLRELQLAGEHVRVDDAFVQALAAIPSLRSLRLDLVHLDAAAIARLAALPLTTLAIESPLDFDAAAWKQLCKAPSVETLSFRELGRTLPRKDAPSFWMPSPDELRALAGLPKLRSLALRNCAIRDEHLAALPATLTELALGGTELTPAGWSHLRRLSAARSLDLDVHRGGLRTLADVLQPQGGGDAADAIADAIGTLRPVSLRYDGPMTPALLHALAQQPDLAELELPRCPTGGFDELARAPALRRLQLCDQAIPTRLTPRVLSPLRESRSLRRVELFVCEEHGGPVFDEREARAQLGDAIELHVHREEFTVKK